MIDRHRAFDRRRVNRHRADVRPVGAGCCLLFAPVAGPPLMLAAMLLLVARRVDRGRAPRPPARSRCAFVVDVAAACAATAAPVAAHSSVPLLAILALAAAAAVRPVPLRPAEFAAAVALPVGTTALVSTTAGYLFPWYVWAALTAVAAVSWWCWWRYPLLVCSRELFSLLSHDLCGLLASVRWAVLATVDDPAGSRVDIDTHIAGNLARAQQISQMLRPTRTRSLSRITSAAISGTDHLVKVDPDALVLVGQLLDLVAEHPESTELRDRRLLVRRRTVGGRWEVAATIAVANRLLPYPHRVHLDADTAVLELRIVSPRRRPARSRPWPTPSDCSSSTAATRSTGRTTLCPAPT